MQWEKVIGLEVHVQLSTTTKIFSESLNKFSNTPNQHINPIDLGYPGVLPKPNAEAIRKAIAFGLAIEADIAPVTVFARKNYFYPDLPKGYQISQLDLPIVAGGKLHLPVAEKTIGITRAHLEEDAGKLVHDKFPNTSGVDLNRAGVPLLEIVSEPDMRNTSEAIEYLKLIHAIVRYLNISDGNMAEGSLRCDANVSVREIGSSEFRTRVEIKNLNSFRFIEQAIEHEATRQIRAYENGQTIVQETRLFDTDKGETRSMRSKEEANDYRYLPDPDIPALHIDPELIASIKATIPELPQQKKLRYEQELHLTKDEARLLCEEPEIASYFEQCLELIAKPKLVASWLLNEVLIDAFIEQDQSRLGILHRLQPRVFANLLTRIEDSTISGKIAKEMLPSLLKDAKLEVDSLIEQKGLKQISNTDELTKIVEQVLADNPQQLEQYRQAPEHKKAKMLGFFVGQAMKASKGKANPTAINHILHTELTK